MDEKATDNFDVFYDRAISLLGRWKKFHDKHPETTNISKRSIEGCLHELTDDFTTKLIMTKS